MAGQVEGGLSRSAASASWLNSQLLRSPPKPWISSIGSPPSPRLRVAQAVAIHVDLLGRRAWSSASPSAGLKLDR